MKNILIFSASLCFLLSCSHKAGMTTSKIKIFGANAFAAGGVLATKANNGLMFYGRTVDGSMSFAKKIDSDTADLEFPNGTWNFYAVGWENTTAESVDLGLRGKVSCAKSLNNVLNGTAATVSLTISNANCDADFSSSVAATNGGTENKLANLSLYSCKSIANITSFSQTSACDSTPGVDATNNKGYATYFRLVVPEYKRFGAAVDLAPAPAIVSKCFAVDTNMSGGYSSPDYSALNTINMPQPGLNGFPMTAQVFYSDTPCDESKGFTTIALEASTKFKKFTNNPLSIQATDRYYLETDAAPVCQDPRRLDPNSFASGKGTLNLPYTICTKDQFLLLGKVPFTSISNSSFELLNNLNLAFSPVKPIGDGTTQFSGNFNGNNHRIENFMINCKDVSPAGNDNSIGIFRKIMNSTISNLTINRAAIECDNNNPQIYDSIGMLAGMSSFSNFKNIKVFGHVSGNSNIGGLVGNSYESHFTDVHFSGGINGVSTVGGIAGYASGSGGSSLVFQSSVNADVKAHCNVALCESKVGGLFGQAYFTGTNQVIDQAVVKLKTVEGNRVIGGVVGDATNITISNSMVTGLLISSEFTDGSTYGFVNMGGLIGRAYAGTLERNIAIVFKKNNRSNNDTSEGLIIGSFVTTQPACPTSTTTPGRNFAIGANFATNLCNVYSLVSNPLNITDPATYFTGPTTLANYTGWSWDVNDQGSGKDIPRLTWELTKELEVPYLKRECSGLYANQAGSGAAADPKTICSASQFIGMQPNTFYILKKNLLFAGATIPSKAGGVYNLDGDGHSLIDFAIDGTVTGNIGLFQDLQAGSSIKNLNLALGKIASSGYAAVIPAMSVGILAGINSGSIDNINMSRCELNYTKLDLVTNSATAFNIGGLVGMNNGTITNSEIDNLITLERPNVGSAAIYAGSITSRNFGTIDAVRAFGSVNRTLGMSNLGNMTSTDGTCTGGNLGNYIRRTDLGTSRYCNGSTWEDAYAMTSNEYYAGVTAFNSGTVSQISFEGSVNTKDWSANTAGNISPFVAYNSSTGVLSDSHIKGRLEIDHSSLNNVVSVNLGSLTRLFFNPNSLSYINGNYAFNLSGAVFTGGTENACVVTAPAITNCSTSAAISYTSPTITIGTGAIFSGNFNWSVGIDFLNPLGNKWLFKDGELSLMATSGNFDKLGKGF